MENGTRDIFLCKLLTVCGGCENFAEQNSTRGIFLSKILTVCVWLLLGNWLFVTLRKISIKFDDFCRERQMPFHVRGQWDIFLSVSMTTTKDESHITNTWLRQSELAQKSWCAPAQMLKETRRSASNMQSFNLKRSKLMSFCRSSLIFEEREIAVSSAFTLAWDLFRANSKLLI